MKQFKILFIALFAISMGVIISCSKSDSPVDEYVKILDNATNQIEAANSLSDLQNLQELASPEDSELIKQSQDYKLTDGDKEKLKKSMDKFMRVLSEKSIEFSTYPDNMKEAAKSQIDLAIDAINQLIDKAETLGDLDKIG